MPTFETTEEFLREYERLTQEQRQAYRRAVTRFVEDVRRGKFRAGLRVKGIRGLQGCFEMTWAGDGRAIFTYGPAIRPDETHIIWLAIGTHSILP